MTLDKDGLHDHAKGSITTATGKTVDPLNLKPEDVDILDIARALSRQCRYAGHVGGFLSVARHSIWVSEVLPQHLRLAGLLHDAAEAYLGDLIRPLKHSVFGTAYLEMEEKVERVIFEKFGLSYPLDPAVADADNRVLIERELGRSGFVGERDRWDGDYDIDEHQFLSLFNELCALDELVLIGLSGYAQSGKDTAGQILVDRYGFTRVAFADTLRDVLYALDPFTESLLSTPDHRVTKHEWYRVSYFVDRYGWEWAKANTAGVRGLLQRLGTEAGRNILGENIWVDAAMSKIGTTGRYVFTDVRFPNEYNAIRCAGGEVWRTVRGGQEAVNAHPSETALDDYSFDTTLFSPEMIGFQHGLQTLIDGCMEDLVVSRTNWPGLDPWLASIASKLEDR